MNTKINYNCDSSYATRGCFQIYKKTRDWHYRQRPEMKAKTRKRKQEYHQRPEVKARKREQQKIWRKRPEVRERLRIQSRIEEQKPERKKKRLEYGRQIEVKKRRQKKYNTPEGKRARRNYTLGKKYGITVEDKEKKFEEQKGLCDFCKKPFKSIWGKNVCCVDHDHNSGRIRALLCNKCNMGVDRDSIALMKKKIQYREHHQILDLMDSKTA